MTRKDYEKIASVIADSGLDRMQALCPTEFEHGREYVRAQIAENMADEFAADNQNFDRARFLKACGVE